MRKMPIGDAFFLINESRETPMHVGGLALFTFPKGVNETKFLAGLLENLRKETDLRKPFGEVLKMTPLGTLGPINLKPDNAIDMEYHVRHTALPKPGGYRELFELISRLHGTLLDRTRPLWEWTVISGLQDRRFAVYFKLHHSIIDGVGAIHFISSIFSPDPKERPDYSPFSQEAYERYKDSLPPRKKTKPSTKPTDLAAVSNLLKDQLGTGVNVSRALTQYAGSWFGMSGKLSVPWHDMPRTSFNRKISGAHRFVGQHWSFDRVRAMGKAFDGTLNDAVLAMCAGALRRYLIEQGELPKSSLKAMAPISLRAEGDVDSANAVGFITADLGTNIADPAERMTEIQASMKAAKEQLAGLTPAQIELYYGITQAPMILSSLTGLASVFPAFSTVISNVPGPQETMYWHGARVEGVYPANIPFDGFGISFTLVSYDGNLDFGITACRRSVPHLQRMIDYLEDSLVELEEAAASLEKPKPKKKKKKAARKKKPAKSKAKK